MLSHNAAALSKEPLIVLFSTGKDSICMLDLLITHHQGPMTVVYLYFVDGLFIKERILRYYEKRYNIKIIRRPCPEALSLDHKKKIKMTNVEQKLREDYDIGYVAMGVRKVESMARRGMLAHLPQGVDERNLKFYPIGELKDREVLSYCKFKKLMLPVEYQAGYKRDFAVPDGQMLLWLKHQFPGDYRKIIAKYPQTEAMIVREQMYGS